MTRGEGRWIASTVAAWVMAVSACSSAGADDDRATGLDLTGLPPPTTGSASSTGSVEATTGSASGTEPGATTTGEGSSSTAALDGETHQVVFDVGSPGGADVPGMTGEDCEELVATIRDFSVGHPDFEDYTGDMAYTGLVLPTLGGDGRPQHNAAYAGPAMITSAATFAQWYADVAGINQAFEIPLTLTDEGAGELVFDSAAFFPIDGSGFGNEGNPHNFHFTTEVRTSFTYTGGEVFTFRGDDDIWVFVDGQLALDLGGLHPALEDTIEMDQLGLVIGQTYPMDIFHAERHTDQSNFRIVTTIACFQPPEG